MNNRKVITICSSLSFYKEVLEIEKKLKKLGYIVIVPKTARLMKKTGDFNVDHYKTWFKNNNDYKIKTRLIKDHINKILKSNAILVVNQKKKGIPGYIGGNVLMEMIIAFHHKKPIYIWNSIDSTSPFEEEIKGLKSKFIDNDLTKIKLK